MIKKLVMLLIAFALVVAPHTFGYDQADAKKGYRSGTKTFNSQTTPTKPDSNMNATPKQNTATPMKNTPVSKPSKGGLMKGLLYGGLAGLLLGSLFGSLGALGALLGFLINVIAVIAVIALVRKMFSYFKNQKKKQELDAWKR